MRENAANVNEFLEIVRKLDAETSLAFDQVIQEGTWVHISFAPTMRRMVLTAHFNGSKVIYSHGFYEMARKLCARAGCPNEVDSGYCATCRPQGRASVNERNRGSASARGYDRVWQRFRRWFLERHSFCEDCLDEGKTMPATEPHHLKRVAEFPELRLVEENLRALCHTHHSHRTTRGE